MQTYPDDYIERWAEVYLANPCIARSGIEFSAFIANPAKILEWATSRRYIVEGNDGQDFAPLLPHQAAIAQILIERERKYIYRGGRFVEPLRHHAFPTPMGKRRAV